jgi:hypothetical protein
VSREGRDGALIRPVFTDLYGTVKSPNRESCGGHLIQSFTEKVGGLRDLLRQKSSSLRYWDGAECHLLDDTIHISVFRGENVGVMELNVVRQSDAMFRHC